jgi:hypothetical protein
MNSVALGITILGKRQYKSISSSLPERSTMEDIRGVDVEAQT